MMRGTIALAAGFALAAGVSPLAAQQKARDCDDARTQLEMNFCAADQYRAADAEMNRAYAQLRAAVDAEERAALLAAQRAWLRFRDAHCAYEAAGVRGGSMEPMVRSGCLAAVTRERTRQLKSALEIADR
jgi:uncharacterized protein YecT (DUF1311 family)